jgi:hypothetical protein
LKAIHRDNTVFEEELSVCGFDRATAGWCEVPI